MAEIPTIQGNITSKEITDVCDTLQKQEITSPKSIGPPPARWATPRPLIRTNIPIISNETAVMIKNSHRTLGGKTYIVEGTIKDVMGIDDPWLDPNAFSNMAVRNYLMSEAPKAPAHGRVYYGKIGHQGYCVHESFLEIKFLKLNFEQNI